MNTKTSTRIKQAMKASNLKQVDIVEKSKKYSDTTGVKLSKTDLSQYVNGKVKPGQKKLYVLAKILDVSEAWLLGYDVDMERISDEERNRRNNEEQKTMAAHFNKEDLTEEEIEEVNKFIEWIKNRDK